MNKKNCNILARLSALFLAIAVLCSCSLPKIGSPRSAKEETIPITYEQYTEEAIQARQLFDKLTNDLFKEEVVKSTIDLHYSLADPSAYGITDIPITFGEFTLDSIKEDFQKLQELQAKLASIKIEHLTMQQQLTYRILSSYLDTELSSAGLELYAKPLTPTIGVQAQLPVLLAEYPFYSKQDVETYLALLTQIDTYYNQLLEFEKEKSAAGLFMSDTSVDHVLESCEAYLLQPDHSFMAETFDTRLDALAELTEEEKAAYKAQNLQTLNEHFIPAYQLLVSGLTALKGTGKNENGLAYYPEGKKYYEYLVHSSTGTSYKTVEDLQAAIENQMNQDLIAMSEIMKTHPDVIDQLDTYAFKYQEPTDILEHLKLQFVKDFPELPPCNYMVKYVPKALQNSLSPAFYLTPPMDRYQDNVIYINGGEQFQSTDLFPTLAHEGYPGHLFQTVYFISKNTDNLRQLLSFGSYSEGWATYVENYSYTMDNGLDPKLGALLAHNSSVTLALHALLDININYHGWNKEQVHDYLSQYYDVEGSDVVESIFSALVENPANYLEYYVGFLEIINMRDSAQESMGDNFNLKNFHKFLLDLGPAPFSVIQPYFQTWKVTSTIKE